MSAFGTELQYTGFVSVEFELPFFFKYSFAMFNILCKEIGVRPIKEISSANVGQLLATFNSFVQVEQCSKVSINSLMNTKYKNEDNTPP